MHLRTRLISACAAALLAASALAGCSGGGSSVVSRQPQTAPADPQKTAQTGIIAVHHVDRAAASAVAAKITSAAAYAAPLKGERPHVLSNVRRIRTGGPKDLAYYGGPTIASEQAINIYVNCGTTCWGGTDPGAFLVNYGASDMIHIVDQYTNSTASNRYTYGGGITSYYDTSHTLSDSDIYNLVYDAASAYGTGYGRMYHVFLQSGVQDCSQSAGGCYNVPGGYCAYHGNVTFGDIGHVIYSVEPYQGVQGCQYGSLVDSTASVLSHEVTEAITDPDIPGNIAWYNSSYGEIGDICRPTQYYGNVNLNGTNYFMQPEYSNVPSACTFTPPVSSPWHAMSGQANELASGADGSVWLVGVDANSSGGYNIWRWNGDYPATYQFQTSPGALKVAVDWAGEPWIITAQHNIYKRINGTWTYMRGQATDIAAGADGSVWILGVDQPVAGGYGVWRWNGDNPATYQYYGGPGATHIAVDSSGYPWITDTGTNMQRLVNGTFTGMRGQATAIAGGASGDVDILGVDTFTGGYDPWHWNYDVPATYQVIGGHGGIRIAVDGSNDMWIIESGTNNIYRRF